MKEILELLLEVAKNYPSLKWPLLFLICAIIVLLWKLIETSVPKIVEHTVAAIRRKYFTNKGDAAQETAIRKFVTRMQSVNWLLCLRSMSKYYVSAPLVEVYYPLRFSFFGSKNYYATKSIEGIMAEDETFAVIGPPGSGKSTLLSIIAITYAEDKVDEVLGFKESRLPLFLSLKYLSDELKPLPQIMAEFLRDAGCNVKDDFIRQQLDNGRCIVLLDGLDETGDSSRRRKIAEWIIKSISSFPDNRFIISCRSTEWESARIPNFPCASIQRLSIDEIQGIVGKWESYFTTKDNQVTSASMKLVNSILRADNHDLRQLAETPLLLTIMVILHLNNIEVPERKVEVYEVFIRTLLGEWDEVKNLGVFNIQNRTENRLLFFQSLCLYLLEISTLNEEINLRVGQLVSFIADQLISIFGQGIEINAFLESIAANSGLIYKVNDTLYRFATRGFLEFMAARALFEANDYEKIIEHIEQEEWYEPIAQFADFLPDSTLLSERLLQISPHDSTLYHRILAHILLGGKVTERIIKEKMLQRVRDFLKQRIPDALTNVDLFRISYSIEPGYWLEYLSNELIGPDSLLETRQVCNVFAIVDDPVALDRLTSMAGTISTEVDLEIIRALKFCPQPKSIDVLWGLLSNNNENLNDAIIDSLSAKGDRIIPSCKNILNEPFHSETLSKAAVSVLCRINNPGILPYLLEIDTSMPMSVHTHIAQELHKSYLGKYSLSEVQTILSASNSQHQGYIRYFKRAIDISFSLFALVTIDLVLPPIALAMALTSPGPIFYKQSRIGRNGKLFPIFHFRTMVMNTDGLTGEVWASRSDPRITPIGRFLRRTRLDALPEYWNVLRGDMSFIGPRPQRPEFHHMISDNIPSYAARLNLKPGVTGLAQVNYKYGDSLLDILEIFLYDLYYVSHCSFLLDLKIMLKTILVVIQGKDSESKRTMKGF